MIDKINELHNQFLEDACRRVHVKSGLISDLNGCIHKIAKRLNDLDEETCKNKAVEAFCLIHKNLCKSLLSYIETPKPKGKGTSNILAKAKSLTKTVHSDLNKLFSKVDKSKSAELKQVMAEISGMMEELRLQADKKSGSNIGAWLLVYAFTVLSDNLTTVLTANLGD